MRKKLSLKQRRFAEAYVQNGGNGTQAALATYNTTSCNCANQIAIENLRNPMVSDYIETMIGPIEVSPRELARTLADELRNGTPQMRRWAWDRIMRLKDPTWS